MPPISRPPLPSTPVSLEDPKSSKVGMVPLKGRKKLLQGGPGTDGDLAAVQDRTESAREPLNLETVPGLGAVSEEANASAAEPATDAPVTVAQASVRQQTLAEPVGLASPSSGSPTSEGQGLPGATNLPSASASPSPATEPVPASPPAGQATTAAPGAWYASAATSASAPLAAFLALAAVGGARPAQGVVLPASPVLWRRPSLT